jgi:hypothetical protein
MKSFFELYPPSSHPKLYPRPVEQYEKGHRRYTLINRVIVVAGILLIAALTQIERSGKWDHVIVTWFYFLQLFPLMLLDLRSLKDFRLMREANVTGTRKADLRRRRLVDYLSKPLLGSVIVAYVAYVLFILYVKQFDYPWFGGYLNIVGVTVVNFFLAAVVLWSLYGKKQNPHQTHEDRVRQIKTTANVMLSVSIAVTLFIALTIALAAFELRHIQPMVQTIYFQLLTVISCQVYFVKNMNFDVYKKKDLLLKELPIGEH